MIIRNAKIEDSHDIFKWRNDHYSFSMSVSGKKVSLQEHNEWFSKSLKNPDKELYIGFVDGQKIGICRFEFDKTTKTSEVSINLNPIFRGKNLSFKFLNQSIKNFKRKNNFGLKATVKKSNIASIKIFERNGFVKINSNKELIFYSNNVST